mmetsp:Transcript_11391/g.41089  ORF Transcript_11391/g.41089 Transcript_11391/m.41089 type:complete len:222 (+) Transcript_11391:588-1253(+)
MRVQDEREAIQLHVVPLSDRETIGKVPQMILANFYLLMKKKKRSKCSSLQKLKALAVARARRETHFMVGKNRAAVAIVRMERRTLDTSRSRQSATHNATRALSNSEDTGVHMARVQLLGLNLRSISPRITCNRNLQRRLLRIQMTHRRYPRRARLCRRRGSICARRKTSATSSSPRFVRSKSNINASPWKCLRDLTATLILRPSKSTTCALTMPRLKCISL